MARRLVMGGPELRVERWSPHPPDAVRALLEAAVEPFGGPFTLRFRVSGAGVVSRSLDAPSTTRPLFGAVDADRLRLACTPTPSDVNPFAPIVRGSMGAEAGGTRLTLVLRPHPMAPGLVGLARVVAGALAVLAAVGASRRPEIAAVAVGFAALFLLIPQLRQRWGFARGCTAALALLDGLLQLQPAPAHAA